MTKKILETKQATETDFEYAWSVYKDTIKSHIQPKLKREWLDAKEQEQFRTVWRPDEAYVITVDEQRIGWGAAKVSEKEVTIDHFYIEPAHQNKGYGSRLTSELLKRWKEEGRTVYANVLKDPRVQAFAQRLGFANVRDDELTHLMQFEQ
jgi:GNAT superfamily N-acetyltransferase